MPALILGRVNTRTVRPTLLVVASAIHASAVQDLFVRRGFSVVVTPSRAALDRYLARGAAPVAAILDLAYPVALEALGVLSDQAPRPLLVGIVGEKKIVDVQDSLDAAFTRPVDRARIFVRVVELVAERKRGRPTKPLITGVIGVIAGNELFREVENALRSIVSSVNAGAILEKVLRERGSSPFEMSDDDVAALLANGRLGHALAPFAGEAAIDRVTRRIATLLTARLK